MHLHTTPRSRSRLTRSTRAPSFHIRIISIGLLAHLAIPCSATFCSLFSALQSGWSFRKSKSDCISCLFLISLKVEVQVLQWSQDPGRAGFHWLLCCHLLLLPTLTLCLEHVRSPPASAPLHMMYSCLNFSSL